VVGVVSVELVSDELVSVSGPPDVAVSVVVSSGDAVVAGTSPPDAASPSLLPQEATPMTSARATATAATDLPNTTDEDGVNTSSP